MAWKPKPGMGDPGANWMAMTKPFDEFMEYIEGRDINRVDRAGFTALDGAIANHDPETRYRTASWLLDHGADPKASWDKEGNVLHILFGQRNLDPVRDAELLRRLLDAGADINKPGGKFGRPLDYLVHRHGRYLVEQHPNPKIDAENRAGGVFFDIMFSRPDLDLTTRAKRDNASFGACLIYWAKSGLPDTMEDRVRAYLIAHGEDPDEVLTPMRGEISD